jgi:hypothetical protein
MADTGPKDTANVTEDEELACLALITPVSPGLLNDLLYQSLLNPASENELILTSLPHLTSMTFNIVLKEVTYGLDKGLCEQGPMSHHVQS